MTAATGPGTVAQAEGLDVHETDDGLVVYQADTDRVHYLNPTAAALFVLAAEPVTATDLASGLAQLWELDEPPVDDVEQCIAQLLDEGVLTSAS